MATVPTETLEKRIQTATGKKILAAARELVAEHGIEDTHVHDITHRAEVARGLANYYFGSKNRLIGEVLDADAADRRKQLHELIGGAQTVDGVIAGLQRTLGELLVPGGRRTAQQEFATLALRDEDIERRLAVARSRYRQELAEILVAHERDGIVQLRADAAVVAAVLISLGQGIVSEQLADPAWNHTNAARYALSVARCMLAPSS